MSDWEISGNKNPWVCPSDRHLALRAQLKSGWSVHTQELSQSKKQDHALSESEQEHIRQVIARAEAVDVQEQERIGKLVERLENMKRRSVGNGTTQCMLCGAEFGLFGPRSYAAMCNDCQKYVCQKNCGVETFDARNEVVFLCKICSEHREMWKKSGAWFYRGVPKYVLPEPEQRQARRNPIRDRDSSHLSRARGSWVRACQSGWEEDDFCDDLEPYSSGNDNHAGYSGGAYRSRRPYEKQGSYGYHYSPRNPSSRVSEEDVRSRSGSYRRRLPQPPTEPRREQQRSPMLKPRWALEHMGRSDSFPERQEDETSSDEEVRMNRHFYKSRTDGTQGRFPDRPHVQRIPCGRTRRITDESDSGPDPDTRSPTPPSSPRGSLATPSSHGGDQDQTSEHGHTITGGDGSDSRSVDSGVVQSDYSQTVSRPNSFQTGNSGQSTYQNQTFKAQDLHLYRSPPVSSSHTVGLSDTSKDERKFTEDMVDKCGGVIPKRVPELTSTPTKMGASLESHLSTPFQQQLSLQSQNEGESTPKAKANSSQVDSSPDILSSPDDESKPSKTQLQPRRRSKSTVGGGGGASTTRPSSSVLLLPKVLRRSLTFRRFRKSRCKRSKSALPRFDSISREPVNLGTLEFSLLYDDSNQTLTAKVISAKNLRAMDSNGFSDPYVKLHLLPGASKSTKLRTKTIPKTLNPVWNEQLIYYGVTEEDRMRKTLRITVLDEDRFGADFLGETRFTLKKLSNKKERHFNVYLEKQMPIERSEESEAERGKILLSLLYNAQQQSLVVGVIRCAELLGLDPSGYSDPYVKISLKPETSKKHHVKTRVRKKTCNPEFNEEFAFPVSLNELPKKKLEITVWDKDVGKHDDYIGGIELGATVKGERHRHWMSCIQNPSQKFQKWHKLLPRETK